MCQRCVRRSKNLGKPVSVRPGLIHVITRQFAHGYAIPLFSERAANYAVEAELYELQQAGSRRDRQTTRINDEMNAQLEEMNEWWWDCLEDD